MRLRRRVSDLPLPPIELRRLVGPTADGDYDNPSGEPIFPDLPSDAYRFVLDWGCGCGRVARQLIQQRPQPSRYVGLDLHKGMVRWCDENLRPHAKQFEFTHQDVYNLGLNPGATARVEAFPVPDDVVTLFLGWSVFTHVNEESAVFYLGELARVLTLDGYALTTWFLFDKTDFPMMQEFQNALFINDTDPTNAVIFDKGWLRATTAAMGLRMSKIAPPSVRGFQWMIILRRAEPGLEHVPYPEDSAPTGVLRAPLMPENAQDLGMDQ